jgi:uncharacterized BrkB/YihY/UPF0761 family membrane protein
MVANGDAADRGPGLLTFAGAMLAIVAALNMIYGLAAISDSKFYVRDPEYILGNLNTWGWVLLIIGVIQFCAVVSIWAGSEWARWVGALSAGANAVVQLMFIPSHPFAVLAVFALDIPVIYGLLAAGGRPEAPT